MLSQKKIAVLGGDLRMAHLSVALAEKSPESRVYSLMNRSEALSGGAVKQSEDFELILSQSDVVIFPLPLLDAKGFVNTPYSDRPISFEKCVEAVSPGSLLFAGRISEHAHRLAFERGVELIDYMTREEFTVLNAIPTAEGAIEIALRERPRTLFGSNCLVVGHGRIGRVLTKLLLAFGANVRVSVRKPEDHAWAKIAGADPFFSPELSDTLPEADIVFNTAPSMVLNEKRLQLMKRNCLIIDLASKPGGVDFNAAERLGLQVVWALSLPGKVAPATAGENILDTIWNILRERGFLS